MPLYHKELKGNSEPANTPVMLPYSHAQVEQLTRISVSPIRVMLPPVPHTSVASVAAYAAKPHNPTKYNNINIVFAVHKSKKVSLTLKLTS